jgi:hypothetical protein
LAKLKRAYWVNIGRSATLCLTAFAPDRANFQRGFETVISMWVNGNVSPQNVESWQEFCDRVNRGLQTFLASSGKGQVVVIFSSGGLLGVAVQRALHLSAQDTCESPGCPGTVRSANLFFPRIALRSVPLTRSHIWMTILC